MKIIGLFLSQFLSKLSQRLSLFLNQLSPEDMQEAKKSMKEKGIKAEHVNNLPPIEEIHGLNIPPVEETYDLSSLFI